MTVTLCIGAPCPFQCSDSVQSCIDTLPNSKRSLFACVRRSDAVPKHGRCNPAMAHDERSLAAIAANSAAASRAWVRERLGRSDVEVLCTYPVIAAALLTSHTVCCVSSCLPSFFLCWVQGTCRGMLQGDAENAVDLHMAPRRKRSE